VFIFITGLTDTKDTIKKELLKCKKEFINFFSDILEEEFDPVNFELFDSIIDSTHRNLKPKISLTGFSGVGKTTITQLIKAEEIPMTHIPTITGDIATIKIGKLHFSLWDYAGQEQFSYLWSQFMRGSDAILIITDSTLENVEKSKFFLELIKEQAPDAHSAVIGNKQDLPDAMKPEQIERILGLKTYSMIANNSENRNKMIQIIADILEMSAELSPLLKPLLEKQRLMDSALDALENARLKEAAQLFEKVSDMCIELGNDSEGKEYNEKAQKIREMMEEAEVAQQSPEAKSEEAEDIKEGVEASEKIGAKIDITEFMVKERPKTVSVVPKDAKDKLKTSAYGHVANPTQIKSQKAESATPSTPDEAEIKAPGPVSPTKELEVESDNKIEEISTVSQESKPKAKDLGFAEILEGKVTKKQLEDQLLDLKMKKGNLQKMALDFDMQELMGEITTEELNEKRTKLDKLEKNFIKQIEEVEQYLKDLESRE